MAIVYQHRRGDTNEVFYIGIGKSRERAYRTSNRNKYWHNTVNKVGYEVDILLEEISWENACEIEKGMIAAYGRKDLGTGQLVNLTDGGEGGVGAVRSVETKAKLVKTSKAKGVYENISKRQAGDNNVAKREEVKRKIAKSVSDLWKNPEYVKNRKPQQQVKCPHCQKEGANQIMKRWHFENCKYLLV